MRAATDTLLNMDDAGLVRLASGGDSAAFDALVGRFQRAVHAVAFAVLSDREAALDVLQESFITAYRRLSDLEDPSKFGPWVCAIARNHARRLLRNRAMRRRRELPIAEMEYIASAPSGDGIERIRDAMSVLAEDQADLVALFYMEGYSVAECARFFAVPQGTVKRRLHDARQRLKKEMTDMVREQLPDFALPEDYRVVIDKPSRGHSTEPCVTWFMDRWVLLWQDAQVVWGDERHESGPFVFWLCESRDGRNWSEPRLLELGAAHADHGHLKGACVLGDRFVFHTHNHHFGIGVYSSQDLQRWTTHPRLRLGETGRSGLFSSTSSLYIVYPTWIEQPGMFGDRVDVLRSDDGGSRWTWLDSPFWSGGFVTDAAGCAVGGRIYIAWREFGPPDNRGQGIVKITWSDDGGLTWKPEPVIVNLLTVDPPNGSLSLDIISNGDQLILAQEVCGDSGVSLGEMWLAVSKDGGRTWGPKAEYSTESLLDPALAAMSDGALLLVGSSRIGDNARPWVVHSHIQN